MAEIGAFQEYGVVGVFGVDAVDEGVLVVDGVPKYDQSQFTVFFMPPGYVNQ